MEESLTPYLNRKTVILDVQDTIATAAKAMNQNEIGCVLVSGKNGQVEGIVTDRDLVCRSLAEGCDANQPISEVMTRELVCADQMHSVLDVVELMKEYGIRRIPVLKGGLDKATQDRLVGLVTLDDLIASHAVDLEDIHQIVTAQVQIREQIMPDRMRTLARIQQTQHQFDHKIKEELGMSEGATKEMIRFVLGSIVKRLQPSGARRLLSPFPKILRDELKLLMVGPDKSITRETLIQGVCARFTMEREEAKECIAKFWQALTSCVGQQVLDNARAKLPQEISELLAGKSLVEEQQQAQAASDETAIEGTVAEELDSYQSQDFDATHSSGFSMPPQSIQQKLQKDWDHSRPN